MAAGECTVGDLAERLDVRESTISQQLALPRKDGLVRTRRDGQRIWYSIASDRARRVLETLFDIFRGPASARRAPALLARATDR